MDNHNLTCIFYLNGERVNLSCIYFVECLVNILLCFVIIIIIGLVLFTMISRGVMVFMSIGENINFTFCKFLSVFRHTIERLL